MAESADSTIKSVEITCSIISSLKEVERMGVTELATHLGYSKSTIHRHLSTLEENQFVVNEEGNYRLSLKFLNIAENVGNQFPNYGVIKREVDKLAEETGEVAHFGIEEHGLVAYLYKSVGNQAVSTASKAGSWQPMHSTSLGKAILANLTPEEIDSIIDQHGLPAKTEKTIHDRDELFEDLESVRQRGFALDDEENVTGLRCIAAPVLDEGSVFGAVSVTGPSSRIDNELFQEILPRDVLHAANVIELNSKLGG